MTALDGPPEATVNSTVARSRVTRRRLQLLTGGLIVVAVIALGGMTVAGLFGAGPLGRSAHSPLVSPSAKTQATAQGTPLATPSPRPTPSPLPTPIPTPIPAQRPPSELGSNEQLFVGQKLISPEGNYELQLTDEGDLIFTRRQPAATVWVAGRDRTKPGRDAWMQGDGNFVLHAAFDVPIWDTGTIDQPGAALFVLDSGDVVVKGLDGSYLWESKYDRGCRRAQPECSSTVKYH